MRASKDETCATLSGRVARDTSQILVGELDKVRPKALCTYWRWMYKSDLTLSECIHGMFTKNKALVFWFQSANFCIPIAMVVCPYMQVRT